MRLNSVLEVISTPRVIASLGAENANVFRIYEFSTPLPCVALPLFRFRLSTAIVMKFSVVLIVFSVPRDIATPGAENAQASALVDTLAAKVRSLKGSGRKASFYEAIQEWFPAWAISKGHRFRHYEDVISSLNLLSKINWF